MRISGTVPSFISSRDARRRDQGWADRGESGHLRHTLKNVTNHDRRQIAKMWETARDVTAVVDIGTVEN
jgi:hypothetical protein